ncbi:hypothetical protein QF042_003225 [Pedobacter sp. W3I1]|nr:hypothetical protein [Pedobacter sp. W3I1]
MAFLILAGQLSTVYIRHLLIKPKLTYTSYDGLRKRE